jgi:hypothetical protein
LTRQPKKQNQGLISAILIRQVNNFSFEYFILTCRLINYIFFLHYKAIEINNEDKSKFLDALVAVMQ